ncbi:protein lifeguard 1-like [Polypterus senegalus]|uniref:protein lifeguard 1-like n=1 Tax=Polypterus senegalus TaxID=55291 RepID=UPI0019645CB6|nr:protein lifeguard 1-like [Polypterus senegalus]
MEMDKAQVPVGSVVPNYNMADQTTAQYPSPRGDQGNDYWKHATPLQTNPGNNAMVYPNSQYDSGHQFVDFVQDPGPAGVDAPPAYSDDLPYNCFSEKTVRRAFIRKVYLTLMVQIAITVGIICMFIYWETPKVWIRAHSWFTFATFPAAFVLIIILSCCSDIRRRVPLNFVFLILFTAVEGLMLGSTAALLGSQVPSAGETGASTSKDDGGACVFQAAAIFQADEVMWAVAATGIVCFSLSIFALQTKWDFTTLSGIIWVFLWTLIASGILFAIIRSRWLSIVYAGSGTLIFSIYLVIDTQMMLGGKHRYSIDPEEYIFAALNLYLDIINLFLFILQIIGLSK